MSDAIKELLSHILERLDSIEETIAKAPPPSTSSAPSGDEPTKMFKNEHGDWVYKTDGLKQVNDRDTGEAGYWVKTKHGKNILVSGGGYPIWLGPDERPDHPALQSSTV